MSSNVSLFDLLGLIALFSGGVLMMRVVIEIFQDR